MRTTGKRRAKSIGKSTIYGVLVTILLGASGLAVPCSAQQDTVQITPGSPAEKALNAMKRGQSLLEHGQPAQALQAFEEATRATPNDPTPSFWIGLAKDQLGNLQGALDAYALSIKKSASIGMDSAQLRTNLGNTLLKLNYLNEAVFDFKRAIEIDSKTVPAHMGLGRALLLRGDNAGAFEEFKRCKVLGSTDPALALFTAVALKEMGNKEDALSQLNIYLGDGNASNDPQLAALARKLFQELNPKQSEEPPPENRRSNDSDNKNAEQQGAQPVEKTTASEGETGSSSDSEDDTAASAQKPNP